MNATEPEVVAHHEAGHAVIAAVLGIPIQQVAVIGAADYSGYADTEVIGHSLDEACCVHLAGCVAQEKLLRGAIDSRLMEKQLRGDMMFAMDCAMRALGDDADATDIEEWVLARKQRVRSLLDTQANWAATKALAAALLERKDIPGPEAEEIMFAAFKAGDNDDA